MKNKVKNKKIYIAIIFLLIVFMLPCNVFAKGTFSVGANATLLNIGGSTTVTISTTDCAGVFNISSSNPGVVSISSSSEFVDGRTNITATANSVGSATITVTAIDVSDTDIETVSGSRSVTINVVNPEPEPTPQPPSNNNNSNNTYTPPKNNNNNNTSKKDSNTYLSYLELSEEGMTPSFVKTKTSYAITVGMDVNEISINADTESDSSYYYVEGNKDLVEGDNNIRVVVVAENGSTRTYNITVTKTSDPIKADAYLENLIIEDIRLTPEFQSEVLEYDLGKIEFNIDKLNILTFTKNENAKVEIVGNENLKVGENEIKIIVTAEDGVTKKEYKLKVTKNEESIDEENALKNTERSSSQKFKDFMENIWLSVKANALLVLMYCFIVVEFIQIVYLYKQLNKKDEILEKYGIDENGEMTTTRSGRRRDLDIINESDYNKKLSSIDIPLEIEDKKDEDDKILKFDEIKNEVDSDNKE